MFCAILNRLQITSDKVPVLNKYREVLYDNRDKHMASVLNGTSKNIVLICGKGHVKGLKS